MSPSQVPSHAWEDSRWPRLRGRMLAQSGEAKVVRDLCVVYDAAMTEHESLQLTLSTVLFLALGSLACSNQGSNQPNVIVVLVDTLRADHMSLYGYQRTTTPFLDDFATDTVVFERARSQAACTFPSVNTLLTSRYAFDFTRQGQFQMGIPEEYPSLAEILKANGYKTLAVSASPIVRQTPSKRNPNAGFGRGFDVFDETCQWREASCVNARAKELLRSPETPFFLYLHYMDPHGPYLPPKSHQRQFAKSYTGHDFVAEGNANPIAEMLYNDGPKLDIMERDIQHLVDLYDDEILYFDGQFEQLIKTLGRPLLDKSLFLLTSDHGEEFLEHDHLGHCRGVWDTLTRVPLLLRFPTVKNGFRVETAVQIVDLVPTVLDYLDLDNKDDNLALEGTSLRSLLEHQKAANTFAFSDQGKYRSCDDGKLHLILDGVNSTAQLFDVRNDPLETTDISTSTDFAAEILGSVLYRWLRRTGQSIRFDEALALSKAKEEELRALGYLQ